MKKILYVAKVDLSDKSSGVVKKILSQIKAMNYEAQVDIIAVEKEYIVYNKKKCGKKSELSIMWSIFKNYKKYSSVYVRYPFFNPLNTILYTIVKRRCEVFVEIPTYPVLNEFDKNNSLKINVRNYFDRNLSKFSKHFVTKYVVLGKSPKLFNVETINLPNGYDFQEQKLSSFDEYKDLNIINVSNLYNIHGIDRLLYGMASYYKSCLQNGRNVYLHLVGEGLEMPKIRKLTAELQLTNYVFFYGSLHGSELCDIYNKCNLGCGTLAWHREGRYSGSPLKTKEYLSKGLPYIYAYDEMNIDRDEYFAKYFQPDDSEIQISEIFAFLDSVVSISNHKIKIYQEGKKRFDWNSIMKEAIR